MSFRTLGLKVVGGVLILAGATLAIIWTSFRVYVPPDKCLVLIRKTGGPRPAGQDIAEPGQKGIQRETLGPGRYFLNPWAWDWELQPLVEVSAGNPLTWREQYAESGAGYKVPQASGDWPQIGVLVNRVGKAAPAGQQVVDPGFRGIQRDVLTPGTYRINPYVFEVKMHPATIVPMGCCGVVTSLLGEMPALQTSSEASIGPDGQPIVDKSKVVRQLAVPGQRGVQRDVLPPGIYYVNPYAQQVKVIWIGYNLMSQIKGEANVEVISFPSKDGFTVDVDVTVVWGLHPAHTAEMISEVGDADRIKQIILSQIRSICRNLGSDYNSTDFISGESRERYQQSVTDTLRRVCREKDLEVLIALISNIQVHGGTAIAEGQLDLKQTIQRGFIAREQELTKQAQRETATVRAKLEEAKVAIDVARETITAETRMRVAEIGADAEKEAREIDAQRDLEVAQIERQIAGLDAQTTRLLGKARADVERLKNTAEADGKRMMVEAFGGGRAYNLYTFASSFKPESIRLIFAGEGTFWTDLSRAQEAASLELLKSGPGH
ncbi:MAG: hypothetical protein CHACPFDD_00060 [Phycisphaerae bacterium]|nr:hypothetical protein [Phycisphaerae bacterium]